ncbi:MAG: hypothetical protein H6Q56_1530, partial [Deltaproteobacteria bacterium]|nr:hypothetical protein [Deltaproteobacteria bacterium]
PLLPEYGAAVGGVYMLRTYTGELVEYRDSATTLPA